MRGRVGVGQWLPRLRSIFRKSPVPRPLMVPEGHALVQVAVAGTGYEGRAQKVLRQKLGDEVLLLRESSNAHDTNAVAVHSRDGEKLGYLPRGLAARIAGWMDSNGGRLPARVLQLKSDCDLEEVGMVIGLALPSELASEPLGRGQIRGVTAEPRSEGGTYVFLQCDEPTLRIVIASMQGRFQVIRHGYSYRRAADGQDYEWYVVIGDAASKESIHQYLREQFGWEPCVVVSQSENEQMRTRIKELELLTDAQREEIELRRRDAERLAGQNQRLQALAEEQNVTTDKLLAIADQEKRSLLSELESERAKRFELQFRAREAEDRLERYRGRLDRQKEDFAEIFRLFCSNIQLLPHSLDVLFVELQDRRGALELLHQLFSGRTLRDCKKLANIDNWWEVHFHTGRGDDGRLYYQKGPHGYQVLVSLKKYQQRDLSYLKG